MLSHRAPEYRPFGLPSLSRSPLSDAKDARQVRLSVSTVGRIIGKAVAEGRVRPASFREGRTKPGRRRSFDGAWGRRWKYGSKARGPGELVRVDHMTHSRDGQVLKEFRAVCPISKFMAARVFSRAAAAAPPVERMCRTGQPIRPHRVLEPPRRSAHRLRRRAKAP